MDGLSCASLPAKQVAACFESLGGGALHEESWAFGCEFGFFQRAAGIDPMGLLRWASIGPDNLLRGLRSGFSGVEDESAITVCEHSDWDWGVTQETYKIRLDHTHLARTEFAPDIVASKVARSLGRLRDKLIDDLATGEKLFIYRTYDHTLDMERIGEIACAISSYGPGQFVYVQTGGVPFTAERAGSNIVIAYIDHFVPEGGRLNWNDDGWERVCRAAYQVGRRGSDYSGSL